MRRYLSFLSVTFLLLFLLSSCQKEASFEQAQPSKGTLQSSAGDCSPIKVGGTYKATQALADSNYIEVTVNVSQKGTYTIYTDTVNGYYFRGTGTFTTVGQNTVRLKGFGTPGVQGTDDFSVMYDGTFCSVSVTVLSSGSGSGGTGVFSLQGSPNGCTAFNVAGTYTQAVAVTTANKVTLSVNVTTAGTWTMTTNTVGGFSFSGSGTFTSTGVQNITLNASGTPTAAGAQTFTVTAGSSTCTFQVTVAPNTAPPAVFTLQGAPGACAGFNLAGTYTQGIALNATNTVSVQVNVTTAGQWTILTNAAGGMTFSGTGVFTNTGVQTIVLNGTGTPSATGTQTFTVTAGSSSCSFTITVNPASPPPSNDYFPRTTNSNWSYMFDGDPTDTLRRWVISGTLSALGNTYNIFKETDGFTVDTSGAYRKSGGDYYGYADVGSGFGLDDPQFGEILFIKDNVAAGTVWYSNTYSGTVNGVPVSVRYKETLLQKDVTVTVNGTPYQNTLVIKNEYEYNPGTGWISLTPSAGYVQTYYSRGIGLIRTQVYDAAGAVAATEDIYHYQVF